MHLIYFDLFHLHILSHGTIVDLMGSYRPLVGVRSTLSLAFGCPAETTLRGIQLSFHAIEMVEILFLIFRPLLGVRLLVKETLYSVVLADGAEYIHFFLLLVAGSSRLLSCTYPPQDAGADLCNWRKKHRLIFDRL